MTVKGTPEEIRRAILCINPDFPAPDLTSIGSGECFYILDGVAVKIELEGVTDEKADG